MLKVAIIVDSGDQGFLLKDLIELSSKSKLFKIEYLVCQNVPFNSKIEKVYKLLRRGFLSSLARVLFHIITFIERLVITCGGYGKYFEKFEMMSTGIDVIHVYPEVSKSGFVYRYNASDISKIKECKIDLLIRWGSGILRGDILDVCKYGVISFHHANNDINRGGPAGFWEVYKKQTKTGFIIQKLTNELDGGLVLFKGSIPTSRLYMLNQIKIYAKSNRWMIFVIENLMLNNSFKYRRKSKPYSNKLYSAPNLFEALKYIFDFWISFPITKLFKSIIKNQKWHIGIIFTNLIEDAVFHRFKNFKSENNNFCADPFLVEREGRVICYYEEFVESKQRGVISAFEIRDKETIPLGVILSEDFHLSFPFVFEADGELLMCPDTHKLKEIRLYRCVNFPNKWAYHKTIIKNIDAADTLIFHKNDRWWLLTNVDSSSIDDHCSELHIYSSDSCDSDNWIPYKGNPVIFDPECARNGGLLKVNNEYYRVFQKQGFQIYGESIGISKIEKIEIDDYVENNLYSISPNFIDGQLGIHTLNGGGGSFVFDYYA